MGNKLGYGGAHLWSQHLGGRDKRISEFEASLVYRVSSRTAKATQRNPVSKTKKKKKKVTNIYTWYTWVTLGIPKSAFGGYRSWYT
jgi:hypothetical protein